MPNSTPGSSKIDHDKALTFEWARQTLVACNMIEPETTVIALDLTVSYGRNSETVTVSGIAYTDGTPEAIDAAVSTQSFSNEIDRFTVTGVVN